MQRPIRPTLIRSALALALAAGSLSGCGGIELIASGISDGTKWVLDQAGARRAPGGSPPPSAAASQPPAAAAPGSAVQPADMPPIQAAPVIPVIKEEPVR